MADDDYGRGYEDGALRSHYRVRNGLARVTLKMGDDTKSPRRFFRLRVTLPSCATVCSAFRNSVFRACHCRAQRALSITKEATGASARSSASKTRATGGPGCSRAKHELYMVDGAAADGTGGTRRPIVQGLLGWIGNLFGKIINVGDANAVTITSERRPPG